MSQAAKDRSPYRGLLPARTAARAAAAAAAGASGRVLQLVAVRAVHRAVASWLERYLGFLAALGANGRVHLARPAVTAAATVAAPVR